MLKNIDPILNADVLYALRSMGHGDDLILTDTNFPSNSVARQTVLGDLLRIDSVSAARAAKAILSVMPLDSFRRAPGAPHGDRRQAERHTAKSRRRCRRRSTRRRANPGRWARSSVSPSTTWRENPIA